MARKNHLLRGQVVDDIEIFDELVKKVFIKIFEQDSYAGNFLSQAQILAICKQASHSARIKNPHLVLKDVIRRMDSIYCLKFKPQNSFKTDRDKILDWLYYEVVSVLSKNILQTDCNQLARYSAKIKQASGCYSLSLS